MGVSIKKKRKTSAQAYGNRKAKRGTIAGRRKVQAKKTRVAKANKGNARR